jgi:hypothetical protein
MAILLARPWLFEFTMVIKLTMVNQKRLEHGHPWFDGQPWSQGGKSMVDHGEKHIQPWLSMVSDGKHAQPWLNFGRASLPHGWHHSILKMQFFLLQNTVNVLMR